MRKRQKLPYRKMFGCIGMMFLFIAVGVLVVEIEVNELTLAGIFTFREFLQTRYQEFCGIGDFYYQRFASILYAYMESFL